MSASAASSSPFTPYTYIQCPCVDTSTPPYQLLDRAPPFTSSTSSTSTAVLQTRKRAVTSSGQEGAREGEKDNDGDADSDLDEEDRTFDPRGPRANYSLYPLEHLLYCEDCHQIRCPHCVLDEIVVWYCPNCLFEVAGSQVKSEGNRCTRSCFQCPICIAPLSVSSIEPPPSGLGAENVLPTGPYVLSCGHCNWTSQEIGIQFEKPNGIYGQLAKIKNGGEAMVTPRQRRLEREERRKEEAAAADSADADENMELETGADSEERLDAESQFANLKAFYQSQLAESSPASALGLTGDYGYGSPGALSRIMGLYTGGSFKDKKSKSKNGAMREAVDSVEGVQLFDASEDKEVIRRLEAEGWDSTPTTAQRREQSYNHKSHFVSDLRPVANLLRTKRSKRCKTCRHILSKPESKIQTTRFRIRLVALNYIPSITIKPLQPPAPQPSTSSLPASNLLTPLKPVQFLLTFKNPLFERVKVSIATPGQTPGRFGSKVTILCPSFEVGANTDAWEEALRDGSGGAAGGGSGHGSGGGGSSSGAREKRRTKAEASEGQQQAEAGKVWERGRNWVSIVMEVVPAQLKIWQGPAFMRKGNGNGTEEEDEAPLREGEDICEIPVFLRLEWEADEHADGGGGGTDGAGGGKDREGGRGKRELAYWCVLGVGKIANE